MIAHLKEFNLEKESLLASGVRENERLFQYTQKLDSLFQKFVPSGMLPPDLLAKAEVLFKWLWIEKPARYKPYGNFRLNNVIDAQLSKDSQAVGNCLGLTLLYNCLLRKMDIYAEALYLKEAFGIRPHVLTVLQTKESMIDVENILSDGFDYKGHLSNPSRTRWGDRELVADIYHSLGNEFLKKGELNKALGNYNIAIHLNPNYENAHLNRAILLDKMESEKKGEYHREE
jgi:tetratricopeptide (TPR) repeat protein